MKNALLVIDMQEDFFAYSDEPIYNEKPLIAHINLLIKHFRMQNLPIIFIRHEDEDLTKGSTGWEIYDKVDARPEDLYINKTTPDSFYHTDLLDLMNQNGVEAITVAGLQTDYCIDTTCRSAFGKDITTTLVADGHSTYDNNFMKADKIVDYHNKLIGSWFAELKTTDEAICKNQ